MSFATSVHCMDGRIQEPVIQYLKANYKIEYIDSITEPGPCKIIAESPDNELAASIFRRIDLSIEVHDSTLIAVSGHYDCAGNPMSQEAQRQQLNHCENTLKSRYPGCKIIKLWVNSNWEVEKI